MSVNANIDRDNDNKTSHLGLDRHNGAVIQRSTLWLTSGFRGQRWGHLWCLGQWAGGKGRG